MAKFILLMLVSFNCFAEWRTEDTQREIAYQVIAAIDWAQTRNISRNPDSLYETNKILGKHPSVDKVDAYFALMGLAHYYVSKSLPDEYRPAWQNVSIGFEVGYVQHNFEVGVSVKF